jgi:hypothetical protein
MFVIDGAKEGRHFLTTKVGIVVVHYSYPTPQHAPRMLPLLGPLQSRFPIGSWLIGAKLSPNDVNKTKNLVC